MKDHNSISDSDSDGDGDGDSDSSVNSISISINNSSSSEDERSNRNTTSAKSSSKRRNQTKASKSSGLKKKITRLPSTTTTTTTIRKNRSSNNKNKNSDNENENESLIKKSSNKKKLSHNSIINNNNDDNDDDDTAPSLLPQSNTARRSKLAREHRITAAQEQEIQEVFHLFAEKINSSPTSSTAAAKKGKKKRTTTSVSKKKKNLNHLASLAKLHVINLRRALTALSLTPTGDELKEYISILDPEGEGLVEYEPFVAICALKINSRIVNSEDHQREVDEAWGLFVREGNDRITLASLREVARGIGEDGVSDELLRDMVLEANGGAGLARGVEKGEFEDVMRKAGVWR